jgi:hypothetical protein
MEQPMIESINHDTISREAWCEYTDHEGSRNGESRAKWVVYMAATRSCRCTQRATAILYCGPCFARRTDPSRGETVKCRRCMLRVPRLADIVRVERLWA